MSEEIVTCSPAHLVASRHTGAYTPGAALLGTDDGEGPVRLAPGAVVPGTRLSAVAECMRKNGFHALPVLVNGALRGIVTSADVLAALCAFDESALESAWTSEVALSAERAED